jgi:ribosomal-protein-serine acetyltransferase
VIKVDDTISLELVEEKHTQTIFDLIQSNKHLLREWLPWVDEADLKFLKQFVTNSKRQYKEKTDHPFVILYNNAIVGRIGIYRIDEKSKTGSIGYWLDENFQGKGIITKACKAILNYAFNDLQMKRIEIKCGTENYKSQRIPELLNFKKEETIKQGEIIDNKFIDLCFYSMAKEDWDSVDRK